MLDVEGYGIVFVGVLVLTFGTGFVVSGLTRLRGLRAGAFGILLAFLLTLLWLESFEFAILAALIATLPTLAGVGLGAIVSRRT